MGQGVVAGDGTFAVTLTRPLGRGHNYLSVVVNGVSSALLTYIVSDIDGVVFDSTSSQPLGGASVTILRSNGIKAVPGVDIAATDTNPKITAADGVFSFLTADGSYKLLVTAPAYTYPTTLPDDKLPPGRSITNGSRGDGANIECRQPSDVVRCGRHEHKKVQGAQKHH